ncbi:MAG: hypothetical protein EBX41_05235 [Chitinophagia bacterium]|nr:hypothetical protein [Chitinophagia bacterium]
MYCNNNQKLPLLYALLLLIGSCAQPTMPTGGAKDSTPPRLKRLSLPDSTKNIRLKQLELWFDEYITLADAAKEITISPQIPYPLLTVAKNKKIILKIPSDTLLEANTTYKIHFGTAIRDINEGNILPNLSYTFSTGSYFDSLKLEGSVSAAATGLPDSESVYIALYNATENDSCILKKKPLYFTKTHAGGKFQLDALPAKAFKLYAIKEVNGNGTYENTNEMIAFADSAVYPSIAPTTINLRIFTEAIDSSLKNIDNQQKNEGKLGRRNTTPSKVKETYTVNIDTPGISKRTFDLNKKIALTYNTAIKIVPQKMQLGYDSNGVFVNSPIEYEYSTIDSTHKKLTLTNRLIENKVYTLKLSSGFATDSAGEALPPAKYRFKTLQATDYGTLKIRLKPVRHVPEAILWVCKDQDTVYYKSVTDAEVELKSLLPGKYYVKIIYDKNRNGKWDTGRLLEHVQPELVTPYQDAVNVKAGWEQVINF